MIDPNWAKAVDVSHWRPIADVAQVVGAGIAMLAAKGTDNSRGTFTDPTLLAHRQMARDQPFDLVSYYHVAGPGDGGDHAERLADLVGPLAANECLVLDVERGSRVDAAYLFAFYARLDALGLRRPFDLAYLSRDVAAMIGLVSWPAELRLPGLWAPRYKSAGAPPNLPPVWSDWVAWQWTDGGATGDLYSCPGVGRCDASVFQGTRAQLQAWVAGAVR